MKISSLLLLQVAGLRALTLAQKTSGMTLNG